MFFLCSPFLCLVILCCASSAKFLTLSLICSYHLTFFLCTDHIEIIYLANMNTFLDENDNNINTVRLTFLFGLSHA